MKTCPVKADLFLTDGQTWQTDMTTLIGVCHNLETFIKRMMDTVCSAELHGVTEGGLCYIETCRPHKMKWLCVWFCFWEDSAAIRTASSPRWTIRESLKNASKGSMWQVSKSQGHTIHHINNKFASARHKVISDVCKYVLHDKLTVS
jgi:hypothetical protein